MGPRVHDRELNTRTVKILSVDLATNTCETMQEKSGVRETVSIDFQRTKGLRPVVGETWIIDRTHYFWSLAACLAPIRPAVTTLLELAQWAEQAGLIVWDYTPPTLTTVEQVAEYLADQGLIVWEPAP